MSLGAFRSAVAFLTVVPVAARGGDPGDRLGRAYFPLVGALVGLAAGCVFIVTAALTAPLLAAVAAVATLAVLTGGLHLDGVADAADGLLGGRARERRLEIMRDPRVGSFGAVALTLVLLGDAAALSAMTPSRALVALIVAGALSRFGMLVVIVAVPAARDDGLGPAAAGGHRALALVIGGLVTVIACALDIRRSAIGAVMVALVVVAVAGLAVRRIGGATGDVYGACAELGQLAALLAFAAH
jgi:adenosylcobinamide-GDP ribazoletransferase